MTSSEQSTSNRPPTTTGRRLGFTLEIDQEISLVLFCNAEIQSNVFNPFSTESYLLNIDLNVLLQVVAIQVEDQVVDKVKTITDDDERELVSEFGFLSITQ